MNQSSSPKPTIPESIDQWIDWLSLSRQSHPTQSLRSLLEDRFGCISSDADAKIQTKLPRELLIDLACIDLIQQLRQGREIAADDFIKQFPALNDSDCILDLIDAELCVRCELCPTKEAQSFIDRYRRQYPQLRNEINELVQLSGGASLPRLALEVRPHDSVSEGNSSRSIDLSYDALPNNALPNNPSPPALAFSGQALPIGAPDWFIGDQCVASSSEHWLIRGRDSTSGETMVLKVIKLHAQTSQSAVELILQACERASRVKHPSWVAPTVAAVQDGYLAVIRPWRFGTHWQDLSQPALIPDRLRQLSQIAYVLQSAHQDNAWHGALRRRNLIIDHQNKIHLVDAVGSVTGLTRWVNQLDGESDQPASPRWLADSQDLLKLVLQDEVDSPGLWSRDLQVRLRGLMHEHSRDCFGFIGDELNRRADQFAKADVANPARLPWRRRLARWIAGN